MIEKIKLLKINWIINLGEIEKDDRKISPSITKPEFKLSELNKSSSYNRTESISTSSSEIQTNDLNGELL